MILVDAAEHQLSVTARLVGQVEGEKGLLRKTLLHHVAENSREAVDGDGFESKAEDPVELAHLVRHAEAAHVRDLRHHLPLNGVTAHSHILAAEESRHGSA